MCFLYTCNMQNTEKFHNLYTHFLIYTLNPGVSIRNDPVMSLRVAVLNGEWVILRWLGYLLIVMSKSHDNKNQQCK